MQELKIMNLRDLAYKESDLYANVIDIYKERNKAYKLKLSLHQIFVEYKCIHEQYAKKSDEDIEALKRGLFIQWYALTEPNYLTGIAELNEKAELKIIEELKKRIDQKETDTELMSMLNYYQNWGWVFDRFKHILGDHKTNNNSDIIKMEFQERGQMGIYWKSIMSE